MKTTELTVQKGTERGALQLLETVLRSEGGTRGNAEGGERERETAGGYVCI